MLDIYSRKASMRPLDQCYAGSSLPNFGGRERLMVEARCFWAPLICDVVGCRWHACHQNLAAWLVHKFSSRPRFCNHARPEEGSQNSLSASPMNWAERQATRHTSQYAIPYLNEHAKHVSINMLTARQFKWDYACPWTCRKYKTVTRQLFDGAYASQVTRLCVSNWMCIL